MRKMLIVVMVLSLAANAFAGLLAEGMNELSLEGTLDFNTASGTLLEADVFYGYFFMDYLEAGMAVSFYDDDSATIWAIGPGAEYNFDLGTELVPYVGSSLQYAKVDIDGGEDKNALILGLTGGLKYFITEYLAVSLSLDLSVANEDIFPNDDKLDNTDSSLNLGMRVFF